jgi:hypothetical protein
VHPPGRFITPTARLPQPKSPKRHRAKILAGFATFRQYSPQVWNPGISTGNVTDDDERPHLLIRHLSDNGIDPPKLETFARASAGPIGSTTVS